jgi:hypothetical protein
MSSWSALLTVGANSNTPRRHGSGQNNEYIPNTRGKLEHSTKTSWPLVLGMFSLFCPLPCLRGVLEFVPSVSNVLIILSTSMGQTRALHEDMEVDK